MATKRTLEQIEADITRVNNLRFTLTEDEFFSFLDKNHVYPLLMSLNKKINSLITEKESSFPEPASVLDYQTSLRDNPEDLPFK